MNLQDEAIARIEELIYGEEDQIWPESRDARGDAAGRLAAAAGYCRGNVGPNEAIEGSARPVRSSAEINRAFVEWADRAFILLYDWPRALQPAARTAAGAEHFVWRFPPRWVKATYGIQDAIGITPRIGSERSMELEVGTGNAETYIERLRLSNEVFADDIVLHAVLADDEGTVSIITSQQHRRGDPATPDFIAQAMRSMGFLALRKEDAFYRASDNVAVFDLHMENVTRQGDVLRVFDPVIIQPTGRLKEIIQNQTLY